MQNNAAILITGATGLVGSALVRCLLKKGYENVFCNVHQRPPDPNLLSRVRFVHADLTDPAAVKRLFEECRPDHVFLAAAKVGGILANHTYRAEFIYKNLAIQSNVIHESYLRGVKKLLFLGTSCIYPRECPQPIKEEYLLASPLEYTNEPYAVAKIAGMKMCESYNLQYGTNFISVMPTNLYGPNENFDLKTSHLLPALIRKMHLARLLSEGKPDAVASNLGAANREDAARTLNRLGVSKDSVTLWGTGKPRRDLMHSNDLADACVFLMANVDFPQLADSMEEVRNTHVNIGTGRDRSILEIAELVRDTVGFRGEIIWDASKPDGTLYKLLDVSRLHAYGWKDGISLEAGLPGFYEYYRALDEGRGVMDRLVCK